MSLELAIQQNTAAIERLIGILTETLPQPVTINIGDAPIETLPKVSEEAFEGTTADPPKKTRAKKEAAPEPRPLEQTAPAPASGATAASATEAAAAPTKLTYTDAATAITQVITAKGTPAAKEILKAFGAEKSLKEVSPAQYAAVISACQAVLA